MKLFFCSLLLVTAFAGRTFAQDLAPATIGGSLFTGTITGATGGANGAGTITTLFGTNGIDYSLSAASEITNPVPFTYTKTGANTASVSEPAVGGFPGVTVAMTFTSAAGGNFAATYTNNSSQSGTFTVAPIGFTSPLANVSTRTALAANGSAITGFVLGGAGARRVLIRAVGPGLIPFGVSNSLANPMIMLWRGNQQIGGNDDYASGATVDPSLPASFAKVGAFALPANSRDAALVVSLQPGDYTAQIRGVTATDAGEVLLEVYFLD